MWTSPDRQSRRGSQIVQAEERFSVAYQTAGPPSMKRLQAFPMNGFAPNRTVITVAPQKEHS